MIHSAKKRFRIALVIFAFLFFSFSGYCINSGSQSTNTLQNTNTGFISKVVSSLIDYADNFKGTRYRLGASGPNRFDCSGFTKYVFSKFGFDLEHSSRNQFKEGDAVKKTALKPGDLVFFSGRRASKNVDHVGIVVSADEDGEFDFIHASNSGVIVSSSDEIYYSRRYIGARRVIQNEGRIDIQSQYDISSLSAGMVKFSPIRNTTFFGSLTDLPKLK